MATLAMDTRTYQFEQLTFDFVLDPSKRAPVESLSFEPDVQGDHRCRNFTCQKNAAPGKAYCSKAHSPFGMLEDEPDNAPIEWTAPEGFYKHTPRRSFG